mmetsp:Transcript_13910/g.13998  ORF Transcript_13910/g.13998 Transcript_13910/m.13998 type:complete len:181 (-) Transcript_13910:225-767(-)
MEELEKCDNKRKRGDSLLNEDGDEDPMLSSQPRRRITLTKDLKVDNRNDPKSNEQNERWRSHRMMDDYVNVVGGIMYPKSSYGCFGYNSTRSMYPVSRVTSMGYLASTNPFRRPNILETWSPLEVSRFEASMMIYGKKFYMIQKYVQSKTEKEIIEFYYTWKRTQHYQQWKNSYIPLSKE